MKPIHNFSFKKNPGILLLTIGNYHFYYTETSKNNISFIDRMISNKYLGCCSITNNKISGFSDGEENYKNLYGQAFKVLQKYLILI